MIRRLTGPVGPAFFILCAVVPVFGQEEAPSPADTPIGWVFRWLNFALAFGGIGYVLVKYTPAIFRGRAEAVVRAVHDAARAREEGKARRREAESKLAGLEGEVARLRAAAERDAAAEAERILALAREEAEKIERAARAEIQAAERAARIELKAAGARLAVERAEALLRQEITPHAESVFFRSFVDVLARTAS